MPDEGSSAQLRESVVERPPAVLPFAVILMEQRSVLLRRTSYGSDCQPVRVRSPVDGFGSGGQSSCSARPSSSSVSTAWESGGHPRIRRVRCRSASYSLHGRGLQSAVAPPAATCHGPGKVLLASCLATYPPALPSPQRLGRPAYLRLHQPPLVAASLAKHRLDDVAQLACH